MENIIKIKHGQTPPQANDLAQYELGFSESDAGLYTKDGNDQIKKINDLSEVEQDISSSIFIGPKPPDKTTGLWVDTSDSEGSGTQNGIPKYYDTKEGEWIAVASTWG